MTTVHTPRTHRIQGFLRRLLVKEGASPAPPVALDGAVRVPILVAAVPSAASLVWTAWSLIDMIPAPLPVGLAAGVVLDVALVAAVVIAWVAPQVAKPAKLVGWLIAMLAAVLVGWHAAQILPVLGGLGLIPLVSKGLWHLALNARLARLAQEEREAQERRLAAQEEAEREAEARRVAEAEEAARAAELSTGLTHEQQAEVAQRRRDAAYARELAAAEQELEAAQAQAAHEAELERIRRAAAQQREMDREDAEVIKQRISLTREIQAGRGLALGSGEAAPDDLSSLASSPEAPLMGFGGVIHSPRSASPGGLEPRLQALLDYVAQAGPDASVRGAAKALDCDPASVRRRRDALARQGHDVSALTRKQ